MTSELNQTERLREEILKDARKKAEEIISNAKKEAETILISAQVQAEDIKKDIIHNAYQEAERKSELILATVPVETTRFKAEHIESLLNSIYGEAYKRLQNMEGIDYPEVLISLAADAIDKMAGDIFNIKISWTGFSLDGDMLAQEITNRINRPVKVNVSEETNIMGPGVIIEDNEGRQIWDNRLIERLKRLWPNLRRKIAVDMGLAM
ncbi:MAG TPA: V-type ATP synthase subunit E family protein [Syntrophorhabdaceae bacterium]|nr:V-type ATP synthase subunit E family protein [Syntrophorhabdaceae bacterium]